MNFPGLVRQYATVFDSKPAAPRTLARSDSECCCSTSFFTHFLFIGFHVGFSMGLSAGAGGSPERPTRLAGGEERFPMVFTEPSDVNSSVFNGFTEPSDVNSLRCRTGGGIPSNRPVPEP